MVCPLPPCASNTFGWNCVETFENPNPKMCGRSVQARTCDGVPILWLYPDMTVAENMSFGLRMAYRPKAGVDAKVKRVAIGRAIVREPDVFLFDAP